MGRPAGRHDEPPGNGSEHGRNAGRSIRRYELSGHEPGHGRPTGGMMNPPGNGSEHERNAGRNIRRYELSGHGRPAGQHDEPPGNGSEHGRNAGRSIWRYELSENGLRRGRPRRAACMNRQGMDPNMGGMQGGAYGGYELSGHEPGHGRPSRAV